MQWSNWNLQIQKSSKDQLLVPIFVVTAFVISGCGAPTKSASDVGSLFTGANITVGKVVLGICETLHSREAAPSFSEFSLSNAECKSAGESSVNYSDLKSGFNFSYEKGTKNGPANTTAKDPATTLRSRSQVWLGQPILNLIPKLSSALKERQAGGNDIFQKDASKLGTGRGLENLVKPTVKELEKIKFDTKSMTFKGKINIKVDGLVSVDNDILIEGKIFSDSVVVEISTTQDKEFKESLLKQFNAMILIVPHANDVYVDLNIDLVAYSIGLDSFLKEKLNTALGSSLKSALDGLLKLEDTNAKSAS
jgi:hypothetical protein